MDVAIIGAGNVGGALARAFVRSGHDVTITARNPERLSEVAAATGASPVPTNAEAARSADVIILATPFTSAADIAAEIRDVSVGRVIVDTTNRMTFGPSGPDMDTTSSNAE